MSWKLIGTAKLTWSIFLLLAMAIPVVPHAQESQPANACQDPRWIVNSGSLKRSQAAFPLEEQRRYLDSSCTFLVVGKVEDPDYAAWQATKVRSITRLAGLDGALADPGVTAVLYDPESWKMTPKEEQAHPVEAVCHAAAAAHARHKLLIATPAVDLIGILVPGRNKRGQRYAAFEDTGLAAGMARCADVFEIQAQGAEMDVKKFHDFVAAEAAQAREANPRVSVFAGISTNPSGQRVSAGELEAAVKSVRSLVNGFWLNIPAGGSYCPRCGEPQPQVAAELLPKLTSEPVERQP